MQYLNEKIINKMNDSRLLGHYRVCKNELRLQDISLHYYCFYDKREHDNEILYAFDAHYVTYLKRILSTRGHVTRKAANGHRRNQRVHQK